MLTASGGIMAAMSVAMFVAMLVALVALLGAGPTAAANDGVCQHGSLVSGE